MRVFLLLHDRIKRVRLSFRPRLLICFREPEKERNDEMMLLAMKRNDNNNDLSCHPSNSSAIQTTKVDWKRMKKRACCACARPLCSLKWRQILPNERLEIPLLFSMRTAIKPVIYYWRYNLAGRPIGLSLFLSAPCCLSFSIVYPS